MSEIKADNDVINGLTVKEKVSLLQSLFNEMTQLISQKQSYIENELQNKNDINSKKMDTKILENMDMININGNITINFNIKNPKYFNILQQLGTKHTIKTPPSTNNDIKNETDNISTINDNSTNKNGNNSFGFLNYFWPSNQDSTNNEFKESKRVLKIPQKNVSQILPILFEQCLDDLKCLNKTNNVLFLDKLSNDIKSKDNINNFIQLYLNNEYSVDIDINDYIGYIMIRFKKCDNNYVMFGCFCCVIHKNDIINDIKSMKTDIKKRILLSIKNNIY